VKKKLVKNQITSQKSQLDRKKRKLSKKGKKKKLTNTNLQILCER